MSFNQKNIYSDIHPSMSIDEYGNLIILKNKDAINSSIGNIWGIPNNSIPFGRSIGSRLDNYIFELVNGRTAQLIRNECKIALKQETRVRANVIVQALHDEQAYSVIAKYETDNLKEQAGELHVMLKGDK